MAVVGVSLALVESLEYLADFVLWYALSSVAHGNAYIIVVMAHSDTHLTIGRSVFKGVRQQVDEHLVEVGEVNPHRQFFILMDKLELNFLGFGLILKHIAYVIDKTDEVGLAHSHLHHTLLNLPQVHNLTYEMHDTVGIALYCHICASALWVMILFYE